MSEKDKIIVEFVQELIKSPQDIYEEAKATILSITANKHISNFVRKAFKYAEECRPKLLEVKGV